MIVIGILLLVLIGGYFIFFSGGERDIDVLVFSKTEGFRHQSIEAGIEAIKQLGAKNNFQVEATEDANYFDENFLKDFEVVVFLNTTGDVLNPVQQSQLARFIQAGGGFVGVHSATDTEYGWPWYGELVGAYFDGHPNNPNVREATLEIVNANHAATDSLPSTWTREDEWYNFKSINPENRVLITIDESSYEGGTNGANHPMSWFKEFDGGRAFYTGLGHTEESFSDPLFLDHLLGGIQYAIGTAPLDYSKAYAEVVPEENRFSKVVFDQNLYEPMELDFLSADEIIFVERRGDIHKHTISTGETSTITTMDVYNGQEDGLLGIAVDPNYAENNWVYLFYSPPGDIPKQHVSRFELRDDQLIKESEKVLLEIPTQRQECCHAAGSLEFGPDGNLFISLGDDSSPRDTPYAPIDEREGRSPWDAQKSAGNTNDLRGKILRIKPEADGTYSTPDGNLFAKDGSEGRPEIYVMGNRNPFRIAIDSRTGTLYWGEVGPDAREDSTSRGPKGYDEFNQAKEAGNYGWPYFIADNKPYHDYDFETGTSGNAFDPQNPINESPNNMGARELPPAQEAMIYYPYDLSEEFPELGTGSRNAMAGPIYYSEDYPDSGIKFPDYFDGKPLFYDWMRQWIFVVNLDENGDFDRLTPFLPNMDFVNIIDMAYGPDGALYILEYGSGWFSQNADSKLARIEYTEGNRAPVATIVADKTIGGVPLTVHFTGRNSIDYDGDELSYSWSFGQDRVQSTETNPTYTFEEPGRYQVQLTVTDSEGNRSGTQAQIMVGNDKPKLSWEITNGNSTFYWPDQPLNIEYEVNVSDAEDGSLEDGGIDPSNVIVSAEYMPVGSDQVLAAKDHAEMADAAQMISPGEVLIGESDCNSCHQMDSESIGPSYMEIADRYAGNAESSSLPSKIRNGGSGNWGDVAMPAHPALSESDAQQMVDYILGLKEGGPVTSEYPPKGTIRADDHLGAESTGSYVLIASYTDSGGQEIGPLTSRETIILRNAKVEAESYDEGQAMIYPVNAEETPGIEEDITIVIGTNGSGFMFKDIDMTDITGIKGVYGQVTGITKGGDVEFRLGGPGGELLGTVTLETGLTDFGFEEHTINVDPITGKQDLYVRFFNPDEEESAILGIMDWIEFIN